MIRFLFKGLLRDRSRSLFPLLIVSIGVVLTVFIQAWMGGAMSSIIQTAAHFRVGHLQVTTKAYAEEASQMPNDLALLGIAPLIEELGREYPDVVWTPRTNFAGILDIPDENGETRSQATVGGLAVDLSDESPEWRILNIRNAIVRGRFPEHEGEILIPDKLALDLNVRPGQTATLMTTTMYGSMSVTNFVVAGTLAFGVPAMDRGMVIANIPDVQRALDMEDGAAQILGFFRHDIYDDERAGEMQTIYNGTHADNDPFSPTMGTFRTLSGMAEYLDYIAVFNVAIIAIFLSAMSIVLWNVSLTGGLRRYGEIGVRLAIGEEKGHVYRSMMAESLMVGFAGSVIGTLIGLAGSFYLQTKGLDISYMMKGSTALMADVIRAQITPFTYVIGFIPGLFATFLGSAIAGIRIYKRQTAQLFKELEA